MKRLLTEVLTGPREIQKGWEHTQVPTTWCHHHPRAYMGKGGWSSEPSQICSCERHPQRNSCASCDPEGSSWGNKYSDLSFLWPFNLLLVPSVSWPQSKARVWKGAWWCSLWRPGLPPGAQRRVDEHREFYRLNCVFLKFVCWRFNPQCFGIWRCLWEVIRFRGGHEIIVLMEDQCPYKKRKGHRAFFFCHLRIQQEGHHLQTKKRSLPRTESTDTLSFDFPASETVTSKCL